VLVTVAAITTFRVMISEMVRELAVIVLMVLLALVTISVIVCSLSSILSVNSPSPPLSSYLFNFSSFVISYKQIATCGDGTCAANGGEDCLHCPQDCQEQDCGTKNNHKYHNQKRERREGKREREREKSEGIRK